MNEAAIVPIAELSGLSSTERYKLYAHEQTIQRGLATFHEVGTALLAIRDERLYRATHHNFDDYCQERWSMTRQRAHQLIEASEVMSNLSNKFDKLPTNALQAHQLSGMLPEAQIAAWASAIETAPEGKVTANHVAVVAHVFDELLRTGAIDPGDGVAIATSDIVKAAVTEETYERMMRQQKHIQEKRGQAPHVTHNSGHTEWYTPSKYIEAARQTLGRIDLDPASSEIANRTVRAETYYTLDDSGLEHEWHGSVWMNPPYAQPLMAQFAEKLLSHINQGDIPQACVLVNNATETAWFQSLLSVALAVCFICGRVQFVDEQGQPSGASPLQGQAVLYFGENPDDFAKNFGVFGTILYV